MSDVIPRLIGNNALLLLLRINQVRRCQLGMMSACVANMGLALYIGGDFILRLRIVLLVGMLWADVMCDME